MLQPKHRFKAAHDPQFDEQFVQICSVVRKYPLEQVWHLAFDMQMEQLFPQLAQAPLTE